MKHRDLGLEPLRRLVAVLEMGEDVLPALQAFCEQNTIKAATITGIGGFGRATVAFYNMETKEYESIHVDEQVEVLSFLGNVTRYGDKPRIHVHCILGHRDGHTTGGHLLSGAVRPTLELVIEELAGDIERKDRPDIGIPLIDL